MPHTVEAITPLVSQLFFEMEEAIEKEASITGLPTMFYEVLCSSCDFKAYRSLHDEMDKAPNPEALYITRKAPKS